jgi:5-methylcytosine-specific restriction endonuclease McrA
MAASNVACCAFPSQAFLRWCLLLAILSSCNYYAGRCFGGLDKLATQHYSLYMTKLCTVCHINKPLSSFERRSDRPGQFRSECRPCKNSKRSRFSRLQMNLHSRNPVGYTPLTKELREILGEPKSCYLCQTDLSWSYYNLDHIIPIEKGGTNELTNLAWACPSCNRIKGTMTLSVLKEKLERMVSGLASL